MSNWRTFVIQRAIIVLTAVITVACTNDGLLDHTIMTTEQPQVTGAFQWTRAQDVESRQAFLRNFGVGYSYNAVRGEYCRWQDIRCQVINRLALVDEERWGNTYYATYGLNNLVTHQQTYFSRNDYVATMDMTTSEEIDLGLYNGEKRTRQNVLEEGLHDQFYYCLEERQELGEQHLIPAPLEYAIKEESKLDLLTQSFQDAVEHLASADLTNLAVVDSFINVWGTHVITHAILGAEIKVVLQNDMWRYTDKVREASYSMEDMLGAYENREESRKDDEMYQLMESSSLYLTAKGGDQSCLGTLIGKTKYDGSRDFNTDLISQWRKSIVFDQQKEEASNVEMLSMQVKPIWDFIIYDHVAEAVKAAVMQDVAFQQSMLADQNFFDVSFPIRYPSAKCQYHTVNDEWITVERQDTKAQPMQVNVESGGRYVAVICHERINNQWLWVCYPIYEGRVNLACGKGVDEQDKVYDVRWVNGTPKVTITDSRATGMFYITDGIVNVKNNPVINYAEGHPIAAYEVEGGVRPDGTFKAESYPVVKEQSNFYISARHEEGINIIGYSTAPTIWQTFDTSQEEGSTFDSYYLYPRNDNYLYIYNQNEIRYVP